MINKRDCRLLSNCRIERENKYTNPSVLAGLLYISWVAVEPGEPPYCLAWVAVEPGEPIM